MNRNLFIMLAIVLIICSSSSSQTGTKKRRPLPYEYGRVVISDYSERAGLAPVVFEHWTHRARFTCRVCHVDVGFAMKAGATGVRAADNAHGFYCGACHNGKTVVNGKTVFESCSEPLDTADKERCARCHSFGKQVPSADDFFVFSKPLPKKGFGNGIDWERAEELGLIKPAAVLDGVSAKRNAFTAQKDFALDPKVAGMPDIVFSHTKHTVWNGCELCHPDIFVGVKKGATHYTMVDISERKFCGACHTTVAFPLADCQGCHSKPVQP